MVNLSIFQDFSAAPLADIFARCSGFTPLRSMRNSHASDRVPGLLGATMVTLQGEMRFQLAVPDATESQKHPLIVMLHGCKQDAEDFAVGTRIVSLALEQGYAVLLPEQSTRQNRSRCWNWFQKNHQRRDFGEPAMIIKLIDSVCASHPIDQRHVYVAGLSAGGAMAILLANLYSDRFAAVCCHSGLAAGIAQNATGALGVMNHVNEFAVLASARHALRKPRPLIVFHGDADTTVHVDNAKLVVSQHQISPHDVVTEEINGDDYDCTRTRHVSKDGSCHLEYWHIHGGGHHWFGGDDQGSYTTIKGPDATAEMLRFFARHKLS